MKEKENKQNIAVSVIVPCYNVENYVRKAITCLVNQTYKNLEIIVIDDASTDNTYQILKELENEYSGKFKLYQNAKNGGLAYTRNFGVRTATSEYIGFIDPDDYVDSNYYEVLVNKLIEDNEKIYINPKYIYTSNSILVEFLGGNYE